MSAIYSRKIIERVGYLECLVGKNIALYEYFERVKRLRNRIEEIEEIYYIPYVALSENKDDDENVIPTFTEIDIINIYHDSITVENYVPISFISNSKNGLDLPKFDVDADYVSELIG
jgi:hypothetical protein